MTSLLACPHCSSPRARVFSRPVAYCRGTPGSRWFLIPGSACTHIDLWAASNIGDDPEPLIKAWNEKATAAAAEISAKRGHTADQAADFLDSLHAKSYREAGTGS
jgi:hypothetical protein